MEGMNVVVASVSGYHRLERSKLIRLITLSGASYIGDMNYSITHLICRKFEGNKYDLAKRLRTKVVNHQWLEDCIRNGKRIPEAPYTLKSGHKIRPLSLDIPDASYSTGVLRENELVFRGLHNLSAGPIIDLEYNEETELCDWDDHELLSKDNKPKNSSLKRTRRHKKVSSDDCGSSSTLKRPRNYHELVKKCTSKQHSESAHDTAGGCVAYRAFAEEENVVCVSDHSYSSAANPGRMRGQSEDILTCNELTGEEDLELQSIRESSATDDVYVPRRSKSPREVVVVLEEEAVQVTSSDAEENINDLKNNSHNEHQIDLPAPSMLSCVICHTEYSSTRGVLPCGHRFCFSCIQSWADHLALKRKTSTCPLCKSPFTSITRVEDADCMDQKIYSQTVPCPLSTQDIVILPDDAPSYAHSTQISAQTGCCQCHSREPEELLVYCQMCGVSCIHSYCLDPPLLPWRCNGCKDARMYYYYF